MSNEHTELRSTFAAPPRSFAPMPAWLLNDELSEEALSFSIEEMASKGIGGVFLHPRTGLEVEYLSEEYWEKLRFVVARCADLDLEVWLCDEYNWPSGTVAGSLLVEHPEYRQHYLDYTTADVKPGRPLEIEIPGEFLAARALCGDDLMDLVGEIGNGKFSWTPPSTGQVILFFINTASSVMPTGSNAPWIEIERLGYLDVLNAEAVVAFMQRTHNEYDHYLSEYYGEVIKGVFTQEPANYHGWQWTPRLPEAFRARKGYDLLAFLHELVWPVGDYVKTRCDYHEIARDLYGEAFYAPAARWAEERGLSFTGSIFQEGDLLHEPGLHGETFSPLRSMDIPGIRWQGSKHGYEAAPSEFEPAPNVGPKLASSAAHASGAKRALVEIAGGAGWEITLSQLRTMVNWALATGISFIKPHAVFQSLKGMRKRDYPPSHFVQEPWWRYYLDFTDYTTRLSCLLSQGTHMADIALLYPTQSLWIEHALKGPRERLHEITESCVALTNALLHLQRDFDYVFETAITEGGVRVENGKLVVGAESFSVLILPPLTAAPLELLSLAQEMVESGGTVLALGRLPVSSRVSAKDRDLLNKIEAIWGSRARRLASGEIERLPGPKKERLAERIERLHSGGGRAVYVAWSAPLTEELAETILSDLLADGPEADLIIDSPQRRDFIYVHRRVDETDVYFVVNLGSKSAEATLGLPASGRVERWDAMTGEISSVPVYRSAHDRVQVPLAFASGEGVVLVLTAEEEALHLDGVRSCEVLEVRDGQAEIHVRGPAPLLYVGEKEIPVTVERALPPLRFRHDWQVEWDGPNTWLLEPWRVKILGSESVGSESQQPERLSLRARLTVGTLRRARKLAGRINPLAKAMRTARFIPMEEVTRRAVRLLLNLGIDPEGLHSHEILRLVRELCQETGVGFKETFLSAGARYEATSSFYADFIPPGLMLVYEDLGEPLEVLINGVPVADPSRRVDVWDRSNRVLNLGSRIIPGRNTVTIRSRVPAFPTTMPGVHSLEPVALVGDFMVKSRHIIPPQRQVQTGDWAEMGLPHYSGRVTYTQRFRLPSTYMGQDLVLEFEDVRETVEVWLNGESAGYCIWPPYSLPIGHLIREGDNELKVAVTNTAANLLGHPQPSGLLGSVRIVSYPRQTVPLLADETVAS